MTRGKNRFLAAALAMTLAPALCTAHAQEVPGLGTANFVDVGDGDGVTGMLSASGLALSTMGMFSAADQQLRPWHAGLAPVRVQT